MSQKNLFIVVGIVVAAIAVIVVVVLLKGQGGGLEQEQQELEDLNKTLEESAGLPNIDVQSNPLEDLPDTNPIEAANPLKNLKTNPF